MNPLFLSFILIPTSLVLPSEWVKKTILSRFSWLSEIQKYSYAIRYEVYDGCKPLYDSVFLSFKGLLYFFCVNLYDNVFFFANIL